MKKTFVAVALILLVGLPAFAGFKFHFGPAITNLNYSESFAPFAKKSMLQFTGGAGFELNFTPNIGLEFDVMYAPGGAKFEYNSPMGDVLFTLQGYGISLPVLLKVSFLPGTTPYIIAGGSLAYTMASKYTLEYPGGSDEVDMIDEDEVNRIQYAAQFGGGVEFAFGGMTFFVEGRYVLGLSNMIKDPFDDETLKYVNIFILFGIKI